MGGRPQQPADAASAPSRPPGNGLTLRQQEILALLRAGKGNKDIANQLGIGLGTVKQHVVALFRKLNVSNRAAAISSGYDVEWHAYPASAAVLSTPADDSLVELRPACVLSVAACDREGGPAPDCGWQALHQAVAQLAGEHGYTTVALPGSGIDIILGLHRVGETDSLDALAASRILKEAIAPAGATLRAGLAAGFLVASMHVNGGWTGESVAGRAIARARELRDAAAPDDLLCDLASRRLMAFASRKSAVDLDDPQPMAYPLTEHRPMRRRPAVQEPDIRVVDRVAELAELRQSVQIATAGGHGIVALIEGEAGMGKTTLARAFEIDARQGGVAWIAARCGDVRTTIGALVSIGRGQGRPPAQPGIKDALAGIQRGLAKGPVVVMLDDVHRAGDSEIDIILALAALAQRTPLALLAVGRRIRDHRLNELPFAPRLRLGRLPPADMARLIADESAGRLTLDEQATIAALAHGVPLFAVELCHSALAQPPGARAVSHPPLSLIALVLSRLDGLGLDRSLLRIAARFDSLSAVNLAECWGDDEAGFAVRLGKTIEAGVLARDAASGDIRFAHPLVREVLRCVMLTERPEVDTWKIKALAD
jgi:DNA-binding CsgD family transcriptional regulator